MLKPSSIFGHIILFFTFSKASALGYFFLPNKSLKKQCVKLFNNISWRYKRLHSEDYLR